MFCFKHPFVVKVNNVYYILYILYIMNMTI